MQEEHAPAAELGLGQPIEWGWSGDTCYVSGEAIVIGGVGSRTQDRLVIEAKARVIATKDLMIQALRRIAAHPYRGGVSPAQARELARTVLRIAGLQEDVDAPVAEAVSKPAKGPSSKRSSKFTEEQQDLIAKCLAAGRGWSKYAVGVKKAGFCTPSQELTLRNMVNRIASMNRRISARAAGDDCDIESDCDEAASLGYQASDFH